MITRAVLFGLLAVTTVTDVRWRKVFNWTTYPGVVLGLALNIFASLLGTKLLQGTDSNYPVADAWQDSLYGFLACFGLMIVCYMFFTGFGGGDVKLMAMIGAFFGLQLGLEALLWTFVIAACMALIILIWQAGPVELARRFGAYAAFAIRHGRGTPVTEADRIPLQTTLWISPSALIGAMIVHFQWF